jgi:hypothetical protein
MDLDTIIYIIITVVIFIVSLVGNKKPKQLPPQEETNDVDYTLNEFEKILQRKEEFANAQTGSENNVEIVQEEQASELSEYYEEKAKEEQKKESIIQKKEEELKIKEEKKEIEEETDDGFDLNSAIIYSSILERKKFRH